ncbi:hypothetical protein M513_04364 [Trichuris suis]|uniref:Uncharacterized protein n=1 Tax=Trichuris suis TaxID=68888 RepID=A0A085MBR8_9BILA|nr:hypothetical protein M513_04364 [Trichuris suis]
MESSIDVRIIPEFDGTHGLPVVEWLQKVELVCSLRGVTDVAGVIPLRLTGGAFAVYLQVPYDERKYGEPKGLIPLMAVVQRNKRKVRPVMDFRELHYSGTGREEKQNTLHSAAAVNRPRPIVLHPKVLEYPDDTYSPSYST